VNYPSLTKRSPGNLHLKAHGTVNNINGFGTVNGVRDPMIRLQF